MKIRMQRKQLKQVLGGLGRIAPRKSGIPALAAVRFSASADGVNAAATDLDSFAVCRLGAEADADGVCICPLKALRTLSKGKGAEAVEIETEGGRIVLRAFPGGQAVEQRAEGFNPQDWPESPPEARLRDAGGILGKLRRVAPFASRETTREALCGICFDPRESGSLSVVATDGRRLTAINSIEFTLDARHIVPATPFLTWKRLGDDARIGFRKEDGDDATQWFDMQAGDWRYTARCSPAEFPNWQQVVPAKGEGEQRVSLAEKDCELMKQALPAFPGCERSDKPVVIQGDKDGVRMLGPEKNGDRAELRLDNSSYKGPGGATAFNRDFLLEAIAAGFASFEFADGMCPARFDDGNGAVHVLMPLRLADMPGEEQAESEQSVRETESGRKSDEAAAGPRKNRSRNSKAGKRKEQKKMTQEKKETTAAERALAICQDAKKRLSDTRAALMEASKAAREAIREQKRQESEMRDVRKGLERIRQIEV